MATTCDAMESPEHIKFGVTESIPKPRPSSQMTLMGDVNICGT